MSEKVLHLSQEEEQWRLTLHNGDLGCYARLEHPHRTEAVVTRIAQTAFSFYDSDILSRYKETETTDATAGRIAKAIRSHMKTEPLVVGITGRSGSGKTTLAKQSEAQLKDEGYSVTTISTDDYNRGKKAIQKLLGLKEKDPINWDAHTAYDIERLALDLRRLKMRMPSQPLFQFDYATTEPVKVDGFLKPADVVLVEGIMANSPVLQEVVDKHHMVNTPVATCIGRRVLRDTLDESRPVSWSGEEILKYFIEVAEPEYLKRAI